MIVNLTPHPIHIYAPGTPDRIQIDGEHEPLCVIEPSGRVARLGMSEVETAVAQHSGLPIPQTLVDYAGVTGLPPFDGEVYCVVSLVVALAERRLDLLSPYREVRNMEGSVIGCRALARPA